ncbi:hypothetical protein FOZ63_021109 [Perkinsus olseni]|uniref:Uncharacterized protein n=1 Tax=Perkinsus olseni TaxID=32597 RepID=A0A7J6T2T4_PEROL|nr:hypothetical protein FOZ63_021109 [Perkinsus olseni]
MTAMSPLERQGPTTRKGRVGAEEFLRVCSCMRARLHGNEEDLRDFWRDVFEAFFLDYPTQESVDPDVFTAVWPAVMDDIEDLWEEYTGKGHGAPRQSPTRKAGSTAEVWNSPCAGRGVEKRGTDRRRILSAARETKRRLQGFERASKKRDESPTGNAPPSKDEFTIIRSLRSQLARTQARLSRKEKEKAVIVQRSWYPKSPNKELDALLSAAQQKMLNTGGADRTDKGVGTSQEEEPSAGHNPKPLSCAEHGSTSDTRDPLTIWTEVIRPRLIDALGGGDFQLAFTAMDITKSGIVTRYEFDKPTLGSRIACYCASGNPRISDAEITDKGICEIFEHLDVESKGFLLLADFKALTKPKSTLDCSAAPLVTRRRQRSRLGGTSLNDRILNWAEGRP